MALSLNDVKAKPKQKAKPTAPPKSSPTKKTLKKKTAETKVRKKVADENLRPWHTSMDSSEKTQNPSHSKTRGKSPNTSELITELVISSLSETWVGRIQIKPKVRIPIPKFLSTREKK